MCRVPRGRERQSHPTRLSGVLRPEFNAVPGVAGLNGNLDMLVDRSSANRSSTRTVSLVR